MTQSHMTIALYRPASSPLEPVLPILSLLKEKGIVVEVCPELWKVLSRSGVDGFSIVDKPGPHCRLVLSLGGDGTFLRAARWAMQSPGVPVAGINAGTLGYLADWEPSELPLLLTLLRTGELKFQELPLLQVHTPSCPEADGQTALNEVSLTRRDSAQMISVQTRIDSMELTTYTGDGLIISTPTGSTGYNLSAGGPILQPGTPALVLTPVAPHTLSQRPLVVDGGSSLSLRISGRSSHFLLNLDGRAFSLPMGAEVKVAQAERGLLCVVRPGYDFAARLRTKLLWGWNPATPH